MHNVEWDDLRFVLAVARDGTLSRAAKRLGLSHTTVGRRVRVIEQRLGVQLFRQTPEGLHPTPAGQDVAEIAAQVEGEVLSLERRVLGRDARLQGDLRVATMDILFCGCRAAFSSFLARYPGVALTVVSSDEEVSLTRREADVMIRMTNTPPEYLVGKKIGQVDFAPYASKALAERVGPGAAYDDYPWLHWDERLEMRRWLDGWLALRAPKARVAMRVAFNSLTLKEAVAAGIGVHFLACFEGDNDPRLVRIGPVESAYGRGLWVLTLRELRNTSRIRAFMSHVEEWARENPLGAEPAQPKGKRRRLGTAGASPRRRARRACRTTGGGAGRAVRGLTGRPPLAGETPCASGCRRRLGGQGRGERRQGRGRPTRTAPPTRA